MDEQYLVDSYHRPGSSHILADNIDSSIWHNLEWLSAQKEKQGKYLQGYDLEAPILEKIFTSWEQDSRSASNASFALCDSYTSNKIVQAMNIILGNLDITQSIKSTRSIFIKIGLVEGRNWEKHVTASPIFLDTLIEILHSINPNAQIQIGDGSGHERDAITAQKISGINTVLEKYKQLVGYVDLNTDDIVVVDVPTPFTFRQLAVPKTIYESDFVISLAKLKTHHWTGVTLAMKNMFGALPGSVYGYPKNRLHWASYPRVISDILSVIKPKLSIIDGIIGIEGNGPLNGDPKQANIIIGGCDPLATDTLAAQVMGFSPALIPMFWFTSLKQIGVWHPLLDIRKTDLIIPFKSPPNLPWLYSSILKTLPDQLTTAKSLLLG